MVLPRRFVLCAALIATALAFAASPSSSAEPATVEALPRADAGKPSPRADVPRKLAAESFISTTSVSTGPDGFPYVSAFRSESGAAGIRTYAMRELAGIALAKHAGIAIYEHATTERPVWVFPLGVVAVLEKGEWEPYDMRPTPALDGGAKLMVGTPSLEWLPADVRKAIDEYMRAHDNVATPKIAMLVVKNASGEFDRRNMVAPNIPRSAFATDLAWLEACHRIGWFLPPGLILVRPPVTDERFDGWFKVVHPVAETSFSKATP